MNNANVLVSGAGIAGPALAYWLHRHGFRPTVVERAPAPREGGYVVDFWGVGFDVAEKMGILPDIERESYNIKEVAFVNERGRRVGGFRVGSLRAILNGRIFSLMRSSLARILYEKTRDDVEYIFGDGVRGIEQDSGGVAVTFERGGRRRFDLAVGADGLHSAVRGLAFGDEARFEKYCGYYTASFITDNYLGQNDVFVSYAVPGKQVGVYSLRGNKLAALFVFRRKEKLAYPQHDIEAQKDIIRNTFGGTAWETPRLLDRMRTVRDFYFDSVSQIRMDSWSRGRVALLGDAAFCPSLLAGQGAALAMGGAYVLAGELKAAGGDHAAAFRRYEEIFRPLIEKKQASAMKFADSFAPDTRFRLWVRNKGSRLLFLPFFGNWYWKRYLIDRLSLRAYE